MAKRLFDVVLSSIALIVASPIMFIVAMAIAVDSPGPVIFKGWRIGRDGRPFRLLKFRSMFNAKDPTDCSVGKNDKRVTRVGVILRRLKLDELPQLLNVLRGDMSIVGPRPEMVKYAATFDGFYAPILSVRPGLTDLATLHFANVEEVLGSDDPDRVYEQEVLPLKNELRLRYVQGQSLRGDISILAATACKLVVGACQAMEQQTRRKKIAN